MQNSGPFKYGQALDAVLRDPGACGGAPRSRAGAARSASAPADMTLRGELGSWDGNHMQLGVLETDECEGVLITSRHSEGRPMPSALWTGLTD
eukprot:gene12863-biopygen503